jgi:hypothetical protein
MEFVVMELDATESKEVAGARDGPPAEERPDTDVVEARDAAVVEASREAVTEGGYVAPRGQHDAVARAESKEKSSV